MHTPALTLTHAQSEVTHADTDLGSKTWDKKVMSWNRTERSIGDLAVFRSGLFCQLGQIHNCWSRMKIITCALLGCWYSTGNNRFPSQVHPPAGWLLSGLQHEYWCSSLVNIVWSRTRNCLSSARHVFFSGMCEKVGPPGSSAPLGSLHFKWEKWQGGRRGSRVQTKNRIATCTLSSTLKCSCESAVCLFQACWIFSIWNLFLKV